MAYSSETREEESAGSQLKHPRLLASYSTKPTTPTPGSSIQQLQKYLAMETTSIDDDCMLFWTQNRSTLDKLVAPALRALRVPVSSAAVERVFSQGGIILRPHQAGKNNTHLQQLSGKYIKHQSIMMTNH